MQLPQLGDRGPHTFKFVHAVLQPPRTLGQRHAGVGAQHQDPIEVLQGPVKASDSVVSAAKRVVQFGHHPVVREDLLVNGDLIQRVVLVILGHNLAGIPVVGRAPQGLDGSRKPLVVAPSVPQQPRSQLVRGPLLGLGHGPRFQSLGSRVSAPLFLPQQVEVVVAQVAIPACPHAERGRGFEVGLGFIGLAEDPQLLTRDEVSARVLGVKRDRLQGRNDSLAVIGDLRVGLGEVPPQRPGLGVERQRLIQQVHCGTTPIIDAEVRRVGRQDQLGL